MNKSSLGINARKSGGAALVEFAIVVPLLLVLLFGFTEFGRMFYQQNQLTKQVAVGARYLARVPNIVDSECDAQDEDENDEGSEGAWSLAIAQADRWIRLNENRDREVLANIEPTFSIRTGSDGSCVIRVEADALFDAMFPKSIIPPLIPGASLNPITLNAVAEERYIGA